MNLHDLDSALPHLLQRVERDYGAQTPAYTPMLIRSAVEALLNKADDEKIVRTFHAIISKWGEPERETIIVLAGLIQGAIREVAELQSLHEETQGTLPLRTFLHELKDRFSAMVRQTNTGDPYWNLVHNGFLHLERLLDGHNPALSVLQRVELGAGLEDVISDLRKLNNLDGTPVRLIAIANWLIGISTHRLVEKMARSKKE